MQPLVSHVVLPVGIIERGLRSLSPKGDPFEKSLHFVCLLVEDTQESCITVAYSKAIENCKDSFGHSARIQVVGDECLNRIRSPASKERGNTGDSVATLSVDFWLLEIPRRLQWFLG